MTTYKTVLAGCFLICLQLHPALADEWPQWRGPQRDGVWRETGIIERFESPEIKARWRVPISSGYTGPTVADGRVYVMDRVVDPEQEERVHCFSSDTGNSLWSYRYPCAYEGISYEAGPRASVLVQDGLAYSLGSMGHLFASTRPTVPSFGTVNSARNTTCACRTGVLRARRSSKVTC